MKTALLFDLDGTLIDSDALHAQVFADLFAPRGVDIDFAYYRDKLHGRLNKDIFADLCPGEDAQAWGDLKEAEYRKRLGAGYPQVPGTMALLDLADKMGWGLGVVTNAPRDNAEAVLDALGISDRFQALVIGDECARGKPDPAPYLEGLRRLDADASASLAFEDSPPGIRSAVAAGLKTIGLRSMLNDEKLRAAGAAATLSDFADPALTEQIDQLRGMAA
ncbi:HAD superfamily hydrolase (TIGR01509 family) [Aliiruegeria haliotis]|uniref:HAD superfamily hydrolase (TIGR01509 family) n=1 Tax=Aliiruegeria haliotis TaxID=1280846 RepID=A0A2T0S054_9RHOB|nr:HAD family phosphatase [Aliiruegeria haliotis]PRY26816.1 HAD superfamily hydrolase (TIGR01509 family) [Aliiruegeria haliotis]